MDIQELEAKEVHGVEEAEQDVHGVKVIENLVELEELMEELEVEVQ